MLNYQEKILRMYRKDFPTKIVGSNNSKQYTYDRVARVR
jgi:hypothetical protein